MNDEAAIRRLIALYGQLLDDERYDEWAELFADDAVWGPGPTGATHVGPAAIREFICGMQSPLKGKHVACATVLDVSGDRALGWTDFIALVDIGESA